MQGYKSTITTDNEENRNRIRDCAQDWETFERTAIGPQSTSPAEGSTTGTPCQADELWKKRMDLAMKIRTTLKDY